jgi:hypothetical protein
MALVLEPLIEAFASRDPFRPVKAAVVRLQSAVEKLVDRTTRLTTRILQAIRPAWSGRARTPRSSAKRAWIYVALCLMLLRLRRPVEGGPIDLPLTSRNQVLQSVAAISVDSRVAVVK